MYANNRFPVFEAEWRPTWEINKSSRFSRKFYQLLQFLSKSASLYVNACDYDIEGSVIGYNIIRFFGDINRAKRMKFSALTKDEILRAYNTMSNLDYPYINAGTSRHYVDWLWGINVSRFLMKSIKKASGKNFILSAGRVQTPTLYEVINRELVRETYVPEPFFRIKVTARLGNIDYTFTISKVFKTKYEAEKVVSLLRNNHAEVVNILSVRRIFERPPPFNLGDLQSEAGRIFGYSPYKTERLAENLYLDGLISYPRTNSQKIPPSVNINEIINEIGRGPYSFLVTKLNMITKGKYIVRQGKEEDPAHPAIYPTGEKPGKLTKDELKLYELILRRFLASISEDAVLNVVKLSLRFHNIELMEDLGFQTIVNSAWLDLYPYVRVESFKGSINLKPGDKVPILKASVVLGSSKPEARYTKISLLKWMEKVGIGTEATRGNIIEILFKRGYLHQKGKYIYPTPLGMTLVKVLKDNFPELVSVDMTAEMEGMLRKVQKGELDKDYVIEVARKKLKEYFSKYEKYEEKIGTELAKPLGLVKYTKCKLCSLEAKYGELCEWHYEALRNLKEKIRIWTERTGYSEKEVMRKLYKLSSVGKYVKDVIKTYYLKDDVSHAS